MNKELIVIFLRAVNKKKIANLGEYNGIFRWFNNYS